MRKLRSEDLSADTRPAVHSYTPPPAPRSSPNKPQVPSQTVALQFPSHLSLIERVMPAFVHVHVWRKAPVTTPGRDPVPIFERTCSRVVFDATPGQRWTGFSTFLSSLSREFDTPAIYLFPSPDVGSSLLSPPPLKGAQPLAAHPDFVFPDDGRLVLVALCDCAPHMLRSRSSGEASSP